LRFQPVREVASFRPASALEQFVSSLADVFEILSDFSEQGTKIFLGQFRYCNVGHDEFPFAFFIASSGPRKNTENRPTSQTLRGFAGVYPADLGGLVRKCGPLETQDRARRIADNRIGIGPEPA